MEIGKRIKELRRDRGLTQQELANELNIARSTLACYEKGVNQVPNDLIVAIAKFFAVSTDFLFGLSEY